MSCFKWWNMVHRAECCELCNTIINSSILWNIVPYHGTFFLRGQSFIQPTMSCYNDLTTTHRVFTQLQCKAQKLYGDFSNSFNWRHKIKCKLPFGRVLCFNWTLNRGKIWSRSKWRLSPWLLEPPAVTWLPPGANFRNQKLSETKCVRSPDDRQTWHHRKLSLWTGATPLSSRMKT